MCAVGRHKHAGHAADKKSCRALGCCCLHMQEECRGEVDAASQLAKALRRPPAAARAPLQDHVGPDAWQAAGGKAPVSIELEQRRGAGASAGEAGAAPAAAPAAGQQPAPPEPSSSAWALATPANLH